MRTAAILTIVVLTGTGGEICLTHAMKLLGEVHDFRPRAIASFVFRAMRVGWLWLSVLLMAMPKVDTTSVPPLSTVVLLTVLGPIS